MHGIAQLAFLHLVSHYLPHHLLCSGAAEELDVSEAELRGIPVLWVALDSGQEWLAAVSLRQPAHWWALQVRPALLCDVGEYKRAQWALHVV